MKLAQWDAFRERIENPNLFKDEAFADWLWNGDGRNSGLNEELEFIAFRKWSHLLGRPGVPRYEAKDNAIKAVRYLQVPPMRASLIRDLQQRAKELIATVEAEPNPAARLELVDMLHEPDYILRDLAREIAFAFLNQIMRQERMAEESSPLT